MQSEYLRGLCQPLQTELEGSSQGPRLLCWALTFETVFYSIFPHWLGEGGQSPQSNRCFREPIPSANQYVTSLLSQHTARNKTPD